FRLLLQSIRTLASGWSGRETSKFGSRVRGTSGSCMGTSGEQNAVHPCPSHFTRDHCTRGGRLCRSMDSLGPSLC
ncbi:hypothetical protein PFISCL1PPCAC_27394, partial [Pristionchus fissidentatus]